MKKRPRRVLCSPLILSMVLPFLVSVKTYPSHVGIRNAATARVNIVPKGNAVGYSITPSSNNILKINSFHRNWFTKAVLSYGSAGCAFIVSGIAAQHFIHPFSREAWLSKINAEIEESGRTSPMEFEASEVVCNLITEERSQ